jgi:transcriptional regulator with XRE-family HTH domain
MSSENSSPQLAQRLRTLRMEAWPGRRITQGELGEALGASPPSISSWESVKNPTPPPPGRLEAYARFFATERSVTRSPFRLLDTSELTGKERTRRDELFRELTELRNGRAGEPTAPENLYGDSHWRFTPGQDVTIICANASTAGLESIPCTHPEHPDYVELYRFADLDALMELFGHIRAVNPSTNVHVRTVAELMADDYTSHLVLLGGVDLGAITANLRDRVELPVRQLGGPGGFEVTGSGRRQRFVPAWRHDGGRELIIEDVARFYRAPNPFNRKRTVTMCGGVHQRGTLGAVRALTDSRFRDRNDQYLRTRFPDNGSYSVVSRVRVIAGKVVTPDWTSHEDVLHEWSD